MLPTGMAVPPDLVSRASYRRLSTNPLGNLRGPPPPRPPRPPQRPPLLLRRAAPHAVLLVGGDGELEARGPHGAPRAHRLGGGDLGDRRPGRADREEQRAVGVSARGEGAPGLVDSHGGSPSKSTATMTSPAPWPARAEARASPTRCGMQVLLD